jgi:hypothetical protein
VFFEKKCRRAASIELTDDEYRALQAASARFHPVPRPGFLSRQAHAILGLPPGNLSARSGRGRVFGPRRWPRSAAGQAEHWRCR